MNNDIVVDRVLSNGTVIINWEKTRMNTEEYNVQSNLDSCRQVRSILLKWQGEQSAPMRRMLADAESEIMFLDKQLKELREKRGLKT